MKFTDEQQNALNAQGRVLVSAAAGSGKTAVLVEKVINLITDENNPVDVDKLLIVTFTNSAAAEMKSRISKRLNEKLKLNPENFNLKRQKLLLSSASICTIDSLCITLAREYFYKLGIPCDFKIADNSVISRLENECIDEIIAENFEKSDSVFLDLGSVFGGESADERLKQNIFKVYDYLCSLPFPEIYIDKVNSMYTDFDESSILFDVVFDYASEIIKNSIASFTVAYEELLEEPILLGGYGEAFSEIDSKLKRALDFTFRRDYNGIRNMLEHYSGVRLNPVRDYPYEQFREKMKNARSKAENTFANLKKVFNCSLDDVYGDMKALAPIVNKFFSLTTEFSERLYEAKKENISFGFSDIESQVLKLLVKRENGEIFYTDEAIELSNKYYAVFVDEYQDTNDLQNTIFNALSDGGKKLFMVGDVKQSIYGFRKANPKNFLNSRNELPLYEEGSVRSKVVMSGNFRSSEDVCDFVNFLFYKLLSDKCGEMFYEQEDMLVPKAKFLPVSDSRVCLDIVSAADFDLTPTECQVYHIADIIENKVNKELCITENDQLRKAEYKDVCILLRSKSEIPVFNEIFRKRNIPLIVDDNEGLLLEKEIVTLFSLLQVIDNPYSDIPLLSTLTGDIFNFSADEIAKIRAGHKKTELFRALLAVKDENEKVSDFIDSINEFREVAAVSSVSKLILKILSVTGYENTVYMYENGELCHDNLLLFKETAKSFEESTGRGLSAFVGYIKRQIKNGNTMQKAMFSGDDNAVRIMTMHRSKGLQFPICILACLNKKFNRQDSSADVVLTEKCGLGLNFIDKNRKIKYSTFPRNASVIENNAISQSEEMRLLYVAMTRAKDYLYMVGADEKIESYLKSVADEVAYDENERFNPYFVQNCDSFLKMLVCGALAHKDGEILRETAEIRRNCICKGDLSINLIEEINIEDEIEIKETETEAFDEQKYKDLCEVLSLKYRYKDLNKIFVKQSASALAHKEFSSDFAFKNEPVFLHNQRLSAAEKGTSMHKFMQYCDLKAAAKSIADEKIRLEEQGKLTKAQAESLKEENLKAFFESEIGQRIVKSDNVFREQGFMVEVKAKDVYDDLGDEYSNEKIIIQGSADLCFFYGDGLFIIDYKTDRADEKELIKRYKTQLDIYALALSQTFERKVIGTAVYSFYNKKLILL